MKKAISLLLVFVLCLSLCACSVDEKYTALLEYLDADNYEGIKSELFVLSPDFRAEQEQMAAYAEKLAKYESVIAFLEAEDYESALADILNRIPVPEEPVYTEVKITLDNWQEYFEIRTSEASEYNDFGELTHTNTGYGLYLKEEYLSRLMENGADVSFKVGVTIEYKECDFENHTLVEGGSIYCTEEDEIVAKVYDIRGSEDTDTYVSSENGQVVASLICGNGISDGTAYWLGFYTDDLEIRDAIGTLMLSE